MGVITGLVAHRKLDEASGNAIDAHGAFDLVDTNTVGAAAGKVGGARDFESSASESFIAASAQAGVNMRGSDFTICGWVKPESLSAFAMVYSQAGPWFELRLNSAANSYELNLADSVVVQSGAPSAGNWDFVVGWRSVVDGKIYLQVNNGTPAESAYTADAPVSDPIEAIGSRPNGSLFWDGLIDEVSLFSAVKTSSERTKLWNSGRGREYPFENGPTAIPASLWLKGGGTYWQDSARTTSASADTDPIGSWYDESYGLGYATQATAGSRPTLQTAEINGVAAVQFDGTDDILTSPAEVASGTPVTVIAVLRLLADGVFSYPIGDVSSFRGIRVTSGRTVSLCDGGQDIASPTPIAGDWVIVTGILDGTNGTLRVNGVQKATAASTVTGWIGGLTVGGRGSGSSCQACQVAEVLLYDSALTGTDLADVEDYLAAKYFPAGGGTTVTPGTASLSLSTFAPTVTASGAVTATPTTAALTTSLFAPTVSTPRTVTPSTVALSLTSFAPTVSTPRLITPDVVALSISTFAPSISTTLTATPGTASLTITTFPPTATAGGNVSVSPSAASLSITTFASTIVTPRTVTPGTTALALSTFAPVVTAPDNKTATPGTASLLLTTFAPSLSLPRRVVPGTAVLTITTYAPSISTVADRIAICGDFLIYDQILGSFVVSNEILGEFVLKECC